MGPSTVPWAGAHQTKWKSKMSDIVPTEQCTGIDW